MSTLDVIPIPGHPGMYARRAFVTAWQAAGSPRLNSAGRLYSLQKHFYDGWRAGKPGFNPADNPDEESQRLAHVRFVAGDIDPTPDRIRRLTAAGLIRPYPYEPWHWELPNVRRYAIVRSIPAAGGATAPAPTPSEEDDMLMIRVHAANVAHFCALGNGVLRHFVPSDPVEWIKNVSRVDDAWVDVELNQLPALLRTYGCDLQIWDVRGGQFVVLDPLTGTVLPGNMWSAVGAARSSIDQIKVTSTETASYIADLAKEAS